MRQKGVFKEKTNEIVQRINRWYVGEECIQVMTPYQGAITILNNTGIVYHHKEGSEVFINAYMEDERRKMFPYHNIPTHYSKGKIKYVNQLMDFDRPYIRIGDGHIIESFAVKDNAGALVVNKVLSHTKSTSFKTRSELEKLIEPKEDQELYYLYVDGTMPKNYTLPSEKDIFDFIKKNLSKNVSDFREYVKDEPHSIVGSYLRKNPMFLDFVEQNLGSLDLNSMKFTLPLNDDRTLLLVSLSDNDVTLKGYNMAFISNDCYKVDEFDIPITKYTLEQIKFLTPQIKNAREPKIPLRLNPGVKKEDIKEAKQMVKSLRK